MLDTYCEPGIHRTPYCKDVSSTLLSIFFNYNQLEILSILIYTNLIFIFLCQMGSFIIFVFVQLVLIFFSVLEETFLSRCNKQQKLNICETYTILSVTFFAEDIVRFLNNNSYNTYNNLSKNCWPHEICTLKTWNAFNISFRHGNATQLVPPLLRQFQGFRSNIARQNWI